MIQVRHSYATTLENGGKRKERTFLSLKSLKCLTGWVAVVVRNVALILFSIVFLCLFSILQTQCKIEFTYQSSEFQSGPRVVSLNTQCYLYLWLTM